MACNKILSYSKLSVVYNFSHKYVKNNSQPFLKLIIKKDPSFKTHQYAACCHYSTIFSHQRSSHRKSNLYATIKYTSPVSFMSTNLDESQYHVVVTNPQSTMDLSSNVSQLSETNSTIANGSSMATDLSSSVASTDLSNVAASLSTDLQTATQYIEPSLASLDLAHWTPVGLIQMLLEYLHISCEMPWWGAIVAKTVVCNPVSPIPYYLPMGCRFPRERMGIVAYQFPKEAKLSL
ncbi:hypothetical protein AVEN_125906-1 [Araneus ventricosus]|uniref:Uncharacterized protein n=1 Tax=Araneus ventricosus TaxID=182803 RepID=A0A4Y2ND36_ARAVE|nr:hypothetical protein AVEN_125906-1 [Araneus ventricosus]